MMKIKVLMVCLGNICRSPLAEGILKSKVDASKIWVDSAGTAGYHVGSEPDRRSIDVAQKHHIDITGQRCRKFTKDDFNSFDFIFAMDQQNYYDIVSHTDNEADIQKVSLLLGYIDSERTEVPDPYYGGPQGFQAVFELVEKACDAIILNVLEPKLKSNG
jgi:protein-tyrosine phosphatase